MPTREDWSVAIKAQAPVRILYVVYPSSPLFLQSDIPSILQEALRNLKADEDDARVISLQTWPSRTLLVFDLCHHSYDFHTAHIIKHIDVFAVHFLAEKRITIGVVEGAPRDRVNKEVADLHRLYGDTPLPLIDEHRNGHVPTHLNPRKD